MLPEPIYDLMKELIAKKYYLTKEEVINKLGVLFAFDYITDDQLKSLSMLANDIYEQELCQVQELEMSLGNSGQFKYIPKTKATKKN
ncbi:MAG: hypothetical protein ACLRZ7_11860 [Lachnospiraceae bacterium]